MTEMAGDWLEVDALARSATVHRPGCPVADGAEDRYCGAARCAAEGGWLWFATAAEVDAFCRGGLVPCGFSGPRDCDRCGGAV